MKIDIHIEYKHFSEQFKEAKFQNQNVNLREIFEEKKNKKLFTFLNNVICLEFED